MGNKNEIKICKSYPLPDTHPRKGGGSGYYDLERFHISNGDMWIAGVCEVSGKAFIQARFSKHNDANDGFTDEEMRFWSGDGRINFGKDLLNICNARDEILKYYKDGGMDV